jgi:2-hydroxy-3-keto-5-methylthiopentenyl-1-phosphate phosphatase
MMGNMNFKTKDVSANGFTARSGKLNDSIKVITYVELNENKLDINKRNSFRQFLLDCKSKGITVCVVKSPLFGTETNNSTSINYIIKECKEQNVAFISYQNDENFADNNNLFYDPDHLNDVGANNFSRDFSHLLIQLNQNK